MRTSAHASRDQPRVQPYATHTAEHEGALSRAHVGRSGRLWHRRLPQEIRISEVDQNLYTFRPVIKKPDRPGCSHNDKKIRGHAKSAARRADQAAQSRCRCGTGEPSPGADVAEASSVPVQMARVSPVLGTNVEGASPVPVQAARFSPHRFMQTATTRAPAIAAECCLQPLASISASATRLPRYAAQCKQVHPSPPCSASVRPGRGRAMTVTPSHDGAAGAAALVGCAWPVVAGFGSERRAGSSSL